MTTKSLGRVSIVPQGDYNENQVYKRLDLVKFDGKTYLSLKEDNTSLLADEDSWMLLTESGRFEDLTPEQLDTLLQPLNEATEAANEAAENALLGISGEATQSNSPELTGFHRYIVTEPITTGSAWGIEVTQSELDDNWVFFNVKDGVITKETKLNLSGKSAYQLALDAGFVGTEADWRASLKGEDGLTTVRPKDTTFMNSSYLDTFVMSDYSGGNFHIESNQLPITPNTPYKIQTDLDVKFRVYAFSSSQDILGSIEDYVPGNLFGFHYPQAEFIYITTNTPGFSPTSQISTDVPVELHSNEKNALLPEYLPPLGERIVEPINTTFVSGEFEREFKMIVDSANANHIISENFVPVTTGVQYTIDTRINYYKFRITGYDLAGVAIAGEIFSNMEHWDTFTFSNPAVTQIKIGSYQDNALSIQLETALPIRILDKSKPIEFDRRYLPHTATNAMTYDYEKLTVFKAGKDFGSPVFRIPFGLVTNNGTMICGSDIRYDGIVDFGKIGIGVTRSLDGGRTWIDKQEVITNGAKMAMDAVIVYDAVNDTTFIFACKLDSDENWYNDGAPKSEWDFGYVKSVDNGKTWSLFTSIKTIIDSFPDVDRIITGVGTGIQMQNENLVVPIQVSKNGSVYSSIIYSTNYGSSWVMATGHTPETMSENNVVETVPGTLLMNARTGLFISGMKRGIFQSTDMGATWIALDSNNLANPGSIIQSNECMGSTIKFKGFNGKNYILHSVPYNIAGDRSNISLFKTDDNGVTWKPLGTIYWEGWGSLYGYTVLINYGGKLFVMMENLGDIQLWDISNLIPAIIYEPTMLPKS